MGPLLDGVVGDELELRRVAQAQSGPQLPPEVPGGGAQAPHHLLLLGLVQGRDIDLRIAQVAGGVHVGDGEEAALEPWVLHRAEKGGQLPLDLLVDPADPVAGHDKDLLYGSSFNPSR